MRLRHFTLSVQLIFFLAALMFSASLESCRRSADELPVMPPETSPLAREYIGFGVVVVSFTHILSEPGSAGVSQAYLRRGTIVRIIERRNVINRDTPEFWVFAEANYQGPGSAFKGWLQAAAVEIYDSEDRANTASKITNQ